MTQKMRVKQNLRKFPPAFDQAQSNPHFPQPQPNPPSVRLQPSPSFSPPMPAASPFQLMSAPASPESVLLVWLQGRSCMSVWILSHPHPWRVD